VCFRTFYSPTAVWRHFNLKQTDSVFYNYFCIFVSQANLLVQNYSRVIEPRHDLLKVDWNYHLASDSLGSNLFFLDSLLNSNSAMVGDDTVQSRIH